MKFKLEIFFFGGGGFPIGTESGRTISLGLGCQDCPYFYSVVIRRGTNMIVGLQPPSKFFVFCLPQ